MKTFCGDEFLLCTLWDDDPGQTWNRDAQDSELIKTNENELLYCLLGLFPCEKRPHRSVLTSGQYEQAFSQGMLFEQFSIFFRRKIYQMNIAV